MILYAILIGGAAVAIPLLVAWIRECLLWRKAYRMGLEAGRRARERGE